MVRFGKSPEHVTGLFIRKNLLLRWLLQVAQPSPGMKVLDLAAAPGGKSTQLVAYLSEEKVSWFPMKFQANGLRF